MAGVVLRQEFQGQALIRTLWSLAVAASPCRLIRRRETGLSTACLDFGPPRERGSKQAVLNPGHTATDSRATYLGVAAWILPCTEY